MSGTIISHQMTDALIACSLLMVSDKGSSLYRRKATGASDRLLLVQGALAFGIHTPCVFRAPEKTYQAAAAPTRAPGWGYPALPAQIVRPAKAAGRSSQGDCLSQGLGLRGEWEVFTLSWVGFFKLAF